MSCSHSRRVPLVLPSNLSSILDLLLPGSDDGPLSGEHSELSSGKVGSALSVVRTAPVLQARLRLGQDLVFRSLHFRSTDSDKLPLS
jgi:hypothetical protein